MSWLHPLLCSTAAFAALCLAMDRHHEDACGHAPGPRQRRGYRALAVAAFALSGLSVWPRADPGIAWAGWTAQLTLAALLTTALATWWPRQLAGLLYGSLGASLLLAWQPWPWGAAGG